MKRTDCRTVAMRGRCLTPKRTEYGKSIRGGYERHEISEKRANMQRLEPRMDGLSNTITTVQKDNLILGKVETMSDVVKEPTIEDYLYTGKDGEQYGIFKLSPKECLRLMGVTDTDADKMLSVNSKSQCYKQAGNSIVVPVLMGIFSQLNIVGITPWNELSVEEKETLLDKTRPRNTV